jgi:hypothetical protein
MKSLDVVLAESIGEMTEAQKNKFFDARVKGSPVEAQVALAAEVLKESSGRGPIRRNNGGMRQLSEAEQHQCALDHIDTMILEGIREKRPQTVKITEQTVGELSESEREDYEFCRLLNMSEADAMRVVRSGGSRG